MSPADFELFPEIPILNGHHSSVETTGRGSAPGRDRGACAKSDVGSIVEAVDALLHAREYFPVSVSLENRGFQFGWLARPEM